MNDPHGGCYFIDVLPTVPSGVEDVNTNLVGIDLYFYLVNYRQHGYSGR